MSEMLETDRMEDDGRPMASRPYLDMIEEAEKAFVTYQEKCDTIDRKFASLKTLAEGLGDREFQMFWANLEVLKPTIYSRAPQPVVVPRHRDGKELHRKASELLERVLELDVSTDDLHETLLLVRDDLAIGARGVLWVLDNGQSLHVDRRDFIHDPARKWQEVSWVARRAYLTREAMKARFPDADLTKVQFDQVKREEANDYKTTGKKAPVWELWHRGEGQVVWVTPNYPDVLEAAAPLMDVKGFFPCPKPAYGTLERGTLKPVPDFVFYRDQVDEINELTARISALAESLRLKGFYAAGSSEVGEAIETAMKATDNKALLVPVASVAALGGTGMQDAVLWLPVGQVAEVITALVALRRQLIEDVYEITGLSDIMRGSTEAQETATAQNLKAQYGSVRVRERQQEMIRIARDVLRLKAEIYAEDVPIDNLVQMAGMELPNALQLHAMTEQAAVQGQQIEGAHQVPLEEIDALLKNQRLRPFVLDVESDSTIAPDEEAEKASRIEFIKAMGAFIEQAGAMVAQHPDSAPFAVELMKFAAASFRPGRELGAVFDQFTETVKARAAQSSQEQGPSPEQLKAQAEMQKLKSDMEINHAKAQAELQKTMAEIEKLQAETARILAQTNETRLSVQ